MEGDQHPDLHGAEGFLGLGTFSSKTRKVSDKPGPSGPPGWPGRADVKGAKLLASSTNPLCTQDRSSSSRAFPSSTTVSTWCSPHGCPGKHLSHLPLERACWGRKPRDWPKGGEGIHSNPWGLRLLFTGSFPSSVLARTGSGLTISGDFSSTPRGMRPMALDLSLGCGSHFLG